MSVRVTMDAGRLRVQRLGLGRWLGPGVDVPLVDVVSVGIVEESELRLWKKGIRLAGVQIPGLVAAGVYRADSALSWWDVGHGRSALVLLLRNHRLARVVFEVEEPIALQRELVAAGIHIAEQPLRPV